jgi:hypothetical protein
MMACQFSATRAGSMLFLPRLDFSIAVSMKSEVSRPDARDVRNDLGLNLTTVHLKGSRRSIAPPSGGTLDRLPPASYSRPTSRRDGINFAFVILNQCCACRYTACACSLSQFFTEDHMAKKAKKAKKTAKAATKKVAKKTSKKRK